MMKVADARAMQDAKRFVTLQRREIQSCMHSRMLKSSQLDCPDNAKDCCWYSYMNDNVFSELMEKKFYK